MTQAPELTVAQWFNTPRDLKLADMRGKVVVIEAFQMLCPGCILHGIPLAQSVQRMFSPEQVAVIGLHTVFEHHQAMTPVSLQAFLHEFRVTFPVAVDAPGPGGMPLTMAAYQMRGTPSLLIIDQRGALRAHHFGQVSNLQLGAEIASLCACETMWRPPKGAQVLGSGSTA
ncbi:redoxin domain-containing protein [Roseovarius sp. Pro17]|uniref:redoxin domain-containing protein n=1 Tax=Roseovarius sp. Pro17 TaxID=3108175 RepID=UPI002D79E1F7|nr:redoxin domain-containing protein [Roseovarius sp. Pro17]